MAFIATSGCLCQCSFGIAPAPLTVLPANRVLCGGMPAASIMDHVPMLNLATFGMCSSPANPTVAAATAAALGVLTPMPCVPVFPAPWVPGSPTVLVGPMPALTDQSSLLCAWGGMIRIAAPGQVACMVP